MNMRNNVKRQHTVPRVYLKNFAEDGKCLYLFDKVRRKIIRASIRDVAVSSNFYDLPREIAADLKSDEKLDLQFIEQYLTSVERDFNPLILELHSCRIDRWVSSSFRMRLSFFMAIQYLRSESMRENLVESRRQIYQEQCNALVKLNFPPEYHDLIPTVSFDKKYDSVLHAYFLFNRKVVQEIATILDSHIWLIGKVTGKNSLYTSDNPIVISGHAESIIPMPSPPYRRGNEVVSEIITISNTPGIAQYGVEIVFPITSQFILILKERQFFSHEAELDGVLQHLTAEEVERYNSMQVMQSKRQIFSKKRDFLAAHRLCTSSPEICTPDRTKPQVFSSFSY
jgi:hypothetical protein